MYLDQSTMKDPVREKIKWYELARTVLTVRLPHTAPARSPAARVVRVIAKPTLVALWQTVLGRPIGAR